MTAISVCIPTVRAATVGATIASIRRQTLSDWELIVVGQGGDEALAAAVASAAEGDDRVRYLNLAERGLSVARNAGLNASTGEIVAMIDDDCEARSDWLAVILEAFEREADLGLVGGSLLAPPPPRRGISTCLGLEPAEVLYDPVATPPPAPPGFDWFGANFALKRAVAERVGPFDELLGAGAFFMAAEDNDYSLRLEAAGVKMLSTPRLVVFHTHGRRYGLRPLVQYWHRNSTGRGAVAAKLTLRGDPRGPAELRERIRDYTVGWVRHPRPDRLLSNAIRLDAFVRGYRRCVRDFRLDEHGLLRRAAEGSRRPRS